MLVVIFLDLCVSGPAVSLIVQRIRYVIPSSSANYIYSLNFTALFTNTRTLKLNAQPTNAFFAAVNQVFGRSSQLTTTAELCSLSKLCTTI